MEGKSVRRVFLRYWKKLASGAAPFPTKNFINFYLIGAERREIFPFLTKHGVFRRDGSMIPLCTLFSLPCITSSVSKVGRPLGKASRPEQDFRSFNLTTIKNDFSKTDSASYATKQAHQVTAEPSACLPVCLTVAASEPHPLACLAVQRVSEPATPARLPCRAASE